MLRVHLSRAAQLGALFVLTTVSIASSAEPDATTSASTDRALLAAINGPTRSPAFKARDGLRHPYDELKFFGITAQSSVVEILPIGGYWTEILAPYLKDHGVYYTAMPPKTSGGAGAAATAAFQTKLETDPETYGRVKITEFGPPAAKIAPDESADFVLTFRNLHNWMKQGNADEVLASFYAALKPGGILGVEDHRGNRAGTQDPKALDGYVQQDYAIALIKQAGFEFVGSTEINANPKDTANWPKGVWTLPPTLALGQTDRATYEAIGEADNFVLKFRKPR